MATASPIGKDVEMEHASTRQAVRIARIVAQTLLILASGAVGAAMLAVAVTFGDCAGWKGIGTCPRVPFWDWEVFRIAFGGGAVPVSVSWFIVKPSRRRLAHAIVAGLMSGVAVGSVVVLITAA